MSGARPQRPHAPPDIPAVLDFVGLVLRYLALPFAVPAIVAVAYGEQPWSFLVAAGISLTLGVVLKVLTPPIDEMRGRDAFLAVSAGWLAAAAVVSVPYLFARLSVVDALFEGMSGLTTTGASVLAGDLADLDRSLLLWRQLTQWLGGLGIVALALVVFPRIRLAGREVFSQETAGPLDLEEPEVSPAAIGARIAGLYVGLTVAIALVLAALSWVGADRTMTLFDAVGHALTVVSTGGFSTRPESVAAFSPATQWVLAGALVVAATNFAVLYATILRRPLMRGRHRSVLRDDELRFLLAVLAVAAVIVTVPLALTAGPLGESTVREAVFTTVSIGTASGFTNAEYSSWPALSVIVVFALMFLGGSVMTACGSIKPLRHLLFVRALRRELQRLVLHDAPPVTFNGRRVEESVIRGALSFAFAYLVVLVLGAVTIAAIESPDRTLSGAFEALATAAATLGTVGPGIGVTGPGGPGYAIFSDGSKLVMCALMWLGRLEILTVAVLLTATYWRPPREP